jgi:hypothetical protein
MHGFYSAGTAHAQAQTGEQIPKPDVAQISAHFYALFAPDFVHQYPDAWIEIAYGLPEEGPNKARFFSAFDLETAAKFAADKNQCGHNVYVGAALRHGEKPKSGRASDEHFLAARYSWCEYDGAGDHERIESILKDEGLQPALMVVTGTKPHQRAHLYFLNAQPVINGDEIKACNTALEDLLDSDDVKNPSRLLRLAGTVNHPKASKRAKGYATEATTLHMKRDAPSYSVEALCALPPDCAPEAESKHDPFEEYGSNDDLEADPELIAAALEYIPNNDEQWGEWNRVAMAAWRATNGSPVAFAAFEKWSRKSRKYNARDTWRKWKVLSKSPPTRVGAGTIFQMALGNGWAWPRIGLDGVDESINITEAGQGAAATDQGTAEPKSGAKRNTAALPLTYFGEFGNKAKKRPILKGFLNKGEISALIAPPKRGKSALMAEITIHCAAGKDWRDSSASEPCGVVIFAIERADLYRRRLDAYTLRDGYKNLPVAVAGKVIDLLNPQCVQTLVATVREAEQHFARPVGLIVIDTYSKGIAAGGGDENSAKDQNRVAANLRRVQELIDVHISCVGHTGKDPSKGARGSNAHLGDVDLMIQITGDTATKTAKVTDANDQPERVIAQFLLELAETGNVDDDGEVETVAIIAKEHVSSRDTGEGKLSDIQRAALNELFNCIADGETAPRPNDVHVPVGVKGLTFATWRKRLAAKRIINPEGNPHEQFKRIHVKLANLGKIGIWEDFAWPIN